MKDCSGCLNKLQTARKRNYRTALAILFFLLLVVGQAGAQSNSASGVGTMALSDAAKALAAGLLAGLFLSGLIAAASKTGISPLPKPLCVAFMESALHRPIGFATGLAFHVAWVAFWSFFYVFLFWNSLTLIGASVFALILWLLSMLFFFPAVGWGYFGWKIGPLASVDAAVSYSLFAVVVWAINHWVFGIGPIWR